MSNASTPSIPDVPEKESRPPAYDLDPRRYQWRFRLMPDQIRHNGKPEENPFRKAAIFVVHGIGEQAISETAATLRVGFEDTVPLVQPPYQKDSPNNWIVPEPYVYEARWSNYGDVKSLANELANLNDGEKAYFEAVWKKRAVSATRSVGWLFQRALRLIWKSEGFATIYYLYLMPLLVFIAASMLLSRRTRRILTDYINDARIYLTPAGDIERMIVQRIDYRVGQRFLKLLGYDWDFNKLSYHHQLSIAGGPHRFQRVVWVAHSLGTVISYNVISDILSRCREMRKKGGQKKAASGDIEQALAAFVTLGSPLDKIAFLFAEEKALRPWPQEYLPGGSDDLDLWKRSTDGFWQNFHYSSDPVSGRLDKFTVGNPPKSLVTNWHTKGWRLWGVSHLSYWHDKQILACVLSLTFDGYVKKLPLRLRSGFMQFVSLVVSAIVWAVVALAVAAGIVYAIWLTVRPFLPLTLLE